MCTTHHQQKKKPVVNLFAVCTFFVFSFLGLLFFNAAVRLHSTDTHTLTLENSLFPAEPFSFASVLFSPFLHGLPFSRTHSFMPVTRRAAREKASRTSQRRAGGLDQPSASGAHEEFFTFDQADQKKLHCQPFKIKGAKNTTQNCRSLGTPLSFLLVGPRKEL